MGEGEVERREDSRVVNLPPDPSADERLAAAHEMRRMGYAWRDIANELGYTEGSVRTDVKRWLQRTEAQIDAEARKEALELDLERLDDLLRTYAPMASNGDTKAADVVIKTVSTRAKLLDYEGLHKTDETASTRTIIIPMAEGDYAQALKEHVEGIEAGK